MTQNIHLIFKTHLDVGFTNYASAVLENYFKKYIPTSLRVARQMRDSDRPETFIWTTGSWLIYEYLEQATSLERAEMEAAIELGEIAWHALPFTTHTELMDPELFRFGLMLSQELDQRYGKKTIAAKMTDVPGHTRGIIPLLAETGVQFLHIGVNPGSSVPDVPKLFRWQDPTGAEIVVMYESGYGSAFQIDGLADSLAFAHTGDNLGPQSPDQVVEAYREIRQKFKGANVFASTLDEFAKKLEPIRQSLPVVTAEIGDTWIHGVGSDPIKVSRYRELLRLRSEWLAQGKTSYKNRHFFNFNRQLLLVAEHTWGMDEKTFLGDHENYSAEDFNRARQLPHFKKFESSWIEKRNIIHRAVNSLIESPLLEEAISRLKSIRPCRPVLTEWSKLSHEQVQFEFAGMAVKIDPAITSIRSLVDSTSKFIWADETHPLGDLTYQTYSAVDYERFYQQYIINKEINGEWPVEDFCKPGLERGKPEHKTWRLISKDCFQRKTDLGHEVLFQAAFDKEANQKYGAPKEVFLIYTFYNNERRIDIDLQWFNKPACRMPEALWFRFSPCQPTSSVWKIEKLGQQISPIEVVDNGNRHLHAVGKGVELDCSGGKMSILPLDSPLVAPGSPSALDFDNHQPDLSQGMNFCLLNNLWGTNFPMWFEEDCRFRFQLEL